MNFKTITTLVVSVLVVVMISAAAIIPVIQASQKTLTTAELNEDADYSLYVADAALEFAYVSADADITINGDSITDMVFGTDTPSNSTFYVLWDTGSMILTYTVGTGWGNPSIYFIDDETGFRSSALYANSIVFDGGEIVWTTGAGTYTSSYTFLMLPASEGSYSAYQIPNNNEFSVDIFADYSSKLFIYSAWYQQSMLVASGTVEKMEVQEAYASSTDVSDSVTVTIGYEPSSDRASSKIDSVSFTGITPPNGTKYIFVPNEYSVVIDSAGIYYVLMGIIPLLIFLVPIMLVVRGLNGRE